MGMNNSARAGGDAGAGTQLARRMGSPAVPFNAPTTFPRHHTEEQLLTMEPPTLARIILEMQQQDFSILRLTSSGAIRAVQRRMGLKLGRELVQIGKGSDDDESSNWAPQNQGNRQKKVIPPFISAAGWRRINTVAGVQLKLAENVLVDGKLQPNPFYVTNPTTGAIERVFCRMIGVGRNQLGNVVGQDHTIIYLPSAYFVEDLHQKENYSEWKGAVEGCSLAKGEEAPKGKFYYPEFVAPDGSSIGMVIDPKNTQVRKVLKTYVQRIKKAISIAQTMAARDILKKILAIPDPEVGPDGFGWVVVTGWVEADDYFQRLNQIISDPDAIAADGIRLDRATVEVSHAEATAHDTGRDDGEVDPEDVEEAEQLDVQREDAVATAAGAGFAGPGRAPAAQQNTSGRDAPSPPHADAPSHVRTRSTVPAATAHPAPNPASVQPKGSAPTPAQAGAEQGTARLNEFDRMVAEIDQLTEGMDAEDLAIALNDAGVRANWKTSAGTRGVRRLLEQVREMTGLRRED